MPTMPFQFKQFSIIQEASAMKVGTDGVILGAWTESGKAKKILDIGTGTGLLALMLAQKSEAQIDAVEIDKEASTEARQNFLNSPWANRLEIFHQSIQEFTKSTSRKYELVVSNPPYFINSKKAINKARTQARHNDMLSVEDLLTCVSLLLTDNGVFCIVIPAENENALLGQANYHQLFCTKKLWIKPTPKIAPKRVLLEFAMKAKKTKEDTLVIEENGRHQYSNAYKKLCKDYYLKF